MATAGDGHGMNEQAAGAAQLLVASEPVHDLFLLAKRLQDGDGTQATGRGAADGGGKSNWQKEKDGGVKSPGAVAPGLATGCISVEIVFA